MRTTCHGTGRQPLTLLDMTGSDPTLITNSYEETNRKPDWPFPHFDRRILTEFLDDCKFFFRGIPFWFVALFDGAITLGILIIHLRKRKYKVPSFRRNEPGPCRFCAKRRCTKLRPSPNPKMTIRGCFFLWLITSANCFDLGPSFSDADLPNELRFEAENLTPDDFNRSDFQACHNNDGLLFFDNLSRSATFYVCYLDDFMSPHAHFGEINVSTTFRFGCGHCHDNPGNFIAYAHSYMTESLTGFHHGFQGGTELFQLHLVEPPADDFCGNHYWPFEFATRALCFQGLWYPAPYTSGRIQGWHHYDRFEPTKARDEGISQETDVFSLMQTTHPRIGGDAVHETCGLHRDPLIYWDTLSIEQASVRSHFFVWITDPRLPGLQTFLRQIPWNGRQCVCCAFVTATPPINLPDFRGPYLVRPQPQNLDGSLTLNFIVITQPHQSHQRVLHVQIEGSDIRRSGTIAIDTLYGLTNVPAVFDVAKPGHRCRTSTWCRVVWRASAQTFIIWWPSAFAAVDFSSIRLDEIDTDGQVQTRATSTTQIVSPNLQTTCPDSGTTDYHDGGALLMTWKKISRKVEKKNSDIHTANSDFIPESLHVLEQSDISVLMHMPREDADQSRSRSPTRTRPLRGDSSPDSSPTNIPSTETSPDVDALVVYGPTLEAAIIPLLEGNEPEKYKLAVQDFLEIPRGSNEALDLTVHPIVPKPRDLAECVTPLMVLQAGQHHPLSATILVDIEMYSTETALCSTEDKNTYFERESWTVPTEMARYELVKRLSLNELCNRPNANSCIILYGQHPWPLQDPYRYPLITGLFLSIKIPVAVQGVPLVMCLHFARNGVSVSQMVDRWNNPPRTLVNDFPFDTDDETLLRNAQAADLEVQAGNDLSSLLATNRPAVGPPVHLMYPPTILIYSRIFGNLNFQIDPTMSLRHFREAIGDLLDISRGSSLWNNFLIHKTVPPPQGVDIFHHEPYIAVLPEELISDYSFVLVDIHYFLEVNDDCQEQTKMTREVFRIQTRSSRKAFLQSILVYELCMLTENDQCEVALQEMPWHQWEVVPRYLLDGATAVVKVPFMLPHIPIDQQIDAARQGMTHQHMIRIWPRAEEALTLLQTATKLHSGNHTGFFRSPVTGLRPPGNPVDFESLDDVILVDGHFHVVDEKPQKLELHRLPGIPTPCRQRPPEDHTPESIWNNLCLGKHLDLFHELLDFDPYHEPLQTHFPEDYELPEVVADWLARTKTMQWDTWDPMNATEFRFHTDGSYNGQTSSWAFCCTVLVGSEWFYLGHQHGTVCQLGDAPLRHSAMSGELHAILWSSFWALRYLYLLGWHGRLSFHWDATVAGKKATGEFANRSDSLASHVRHVQQALEAYLGHTSISHKHAKAHTGIPENELSDFLAKKAIEHQILNMNLTGQLCTFLAQPDASLQWLWWYFASQKESGSLPDYADGQIKWQSRSDGDYDPNFIVRTAMFPNQPAMPVNDSCMSFDLQIGTYNCLSLGDSNMSIQIPGLQDVGRVPFLRHKAMELGFHLLGIQEARTPHGMVRSYNYTRFCSGKNPDGTLGVELWISMDRPYGYDPDGRAIHFQPQDFAVIHSDPRLLILDFTASWLSFYIVVGHAPHSGTAKHVRQAWWDRLSELLEPQRARDGIFLLDANARVASHEDAYFGEIKDGLTDHAAELLRTLASSFRVFAPATFSSFHSGPIATWFHPAYDFAARIDYVLLPLSWKASQISSWTEPRLNSGYAVLDHICAATEVAWTAWAPIPPVASRKFDRSQASDPANREVICHILNDMPTVSWQSNASQHLAEITRYLQDSLCDHFPYKGKRRRPPGASQEAQDLFTQLTYAKRQLRSYSEFQKTLILQWVFDAWSGRSQVNTENWAKHFCYVLATWTMRVPTLSRQLRAVLKRDRLNFIQGVADEAATCNAQDVYRMLRPLMQPKRKARDPLQPIPQVLKLDGRLTTSVQELRARWEEHFSMLEAGRSICPEKLVSEIIERQKRNCLPTSWEPRDIPTLSSLEDAFRRCKPHRAPGPDLIPPDLLRIAPGLMAQKLYPVLLKQCLRLEEPASSKGGKLVKLYKGRGAFKDCGNHRGILLMNVFGKALRSACRNIVNDPYAKNTADLQLGGKPSSQVLYGSQAVRHFLAWGRATSKTTAVIFCDVAAAYYRALRELTLGFGTETPDLENLAAKLDLHPDLLPRLHAAAEGKAAYDMLDPSETQKAYLQEGLSGTWFHMGNDSVDGRCISTSRGSRPGDAWADAIFNALFSAVLDELHRGLREAGFDFEIQIPATKNPFFMVSSEDTTNVFQTTWADDLAILLHIKDPEMTEKCLGVATGILLDSLKSHGMDATIGEGKTAALVLVRGSNSVAVRRRLFSVPEPHIMALQESDTPVKLPLVAQYKHLGGILDSQCNMLGELKARANKAKSAYWRIAKTIFRQKTLPLKTKCQIFRATVLAVMTWGSGSWPALSQKEADFFHKTIWELYRLLVPRHDQFGLKRYSHFDLLLILELPHPEDLLHEARCRHFGNMITSAPSQLWALFALDTGSQHAYREAMKWCWQAIQRDGILPHFDDWDVWEATIKTTPIVWKNTIKKAGKRHQWRRLRLGFIAQWETFMVNSMKEHHLVANLRPPVGQRHCCLVCDVAFGQKRAWFLHSYSKHGYLSRHGQAAQGKYCPKCEKLYKSEASLLNHLRYSKSCCDLFWQCRNDTFDQPDAQIGHPQCPWIPVNCNVLLPMAIEPVDERRQLAIDLQKTLCKFVPPEDEAYFEPALLESFCQTCTRVMPFPDLCAAVEDWIATLGNDFDPILRSVISSLQTWLTKDRNGSQVFGSGAPADFDTIRILQATAQATPRKEWRPKEFLFLHLCSGRRRHGDLQMCLEELQFDAILTVISVDIAIDPTICDLLCPSQSDRWVAMAFSGEFVGAGMGPPCESWSIARFHQLPDAQAGGRNPRPIRRLSDLWGQTDVTWKEHTQLDTGNRLLAVGVKILMGQAVNGHFAFLEHPDDPHQWQCIHQDAPTIWATRPLRWCTETGLCARLRTLQGHFGAKSAKPTCLLLTGIEASAASSIEVDYRTHSLPSSGSIGKQGNAWATTSLKEYPKSFCTMIAALFNHACCSIEPLPLRSSATDLQWIHKLCIDLDQCPRRQAPGPDFAGGTARVIR